MDGFTFQPSPRRTGTTRNVPTLQRQKSILKNPSPPTSYSSPSSLRQVIAEGIAQAGQPQSVKNMAARRAYLWGLVAQGGPPKDLDALVREIKHLDTEIKAARPPRPEWRSCRCCRPNTAAIWETEDGQAVSREDNSWDTSSNELSDEEDLDEPEYMCVRSRSKSLDMEALTMRLVELENENIWAEEDALSNTPRLRPDVDDYDDSSDSDSDCEGTRKTSGGWVLAN